MQHGVTDGVSQPYQPLMVSLVLATVFSTKQEGVRERRNNYYRENFLSDYDCNNLP